MYEQVCICEIQVFLQVIKIIANKNIIYTIMKRFIKINTLKTVEIITAQWQKDIAGWQSLAASSRDPHRRTYYLHMAKRSENLLAAELQAAVDPSYEVYYPM